MACYLNWYQHRHGHVTLPLQDGSSNFHHQENKQDEMEKKDPEAKARNNLKHRLINVCCHCGTTMEFNDTG